MIRDGVKVVLTSSAVANGRAQAYSCVAAKIVLGLSCCGREGRPVPVFVCRTKQVAKS